MEKISETRRPNAQMLKGVVYRLNESLASMGHSSIGNWFVLLVSVIHWLSVSTYQAPPSLVVLGPPLLLIAIVKLGTGQNHVFQSVFIHFQSFQDVLISSTPVISGPGSATASDRYCKTRHRTKPRFSISFHPFPIFSRRFNIDLWLFL